MVDDTGKWSLVWEATTWTLNSMTFDTPIRNRDYPLFTDFAIVTGSL